ncbi:MAG: transcription elongation factor GreA [Clostridia bacterium]
MEQILVRKCKYEAMEKTLELCETTKREEISEQIQRAKEFGDLSENAEYSAAKDAQNENETAIAKLRETLKVIGIIDPKKVKTSAVGLGTVVTIIDEEFGDEDTYTILSSLEANSDNNIISILSPLGSSLLGHKVGESITVKTPGGKFIAKIKAISKCNNL